MLILAFWYDIISAENLTAQALKGFVFFGKNVESTI